MILACPACSATFKIPDGAIPPEGRKVRCAKCKHSWHTDPQTIAREEQALVQAMTAVPVAAPPARAPAPQNFDGDLDETITEETSALRRTVDDAVDESPASNERADDDIFDDDGSEGGSPVSSEDDFGIGAAARELLGDDFSESDDSTGDDDLDDYDDDDFLAHRRADQRRQHERDASDRRQKLMMVGWGGLLLFWIVTFYILTVEKERMLYKFPGMTSFYSIFESIDEKELYRPEEGETLTPSPALAEVYISAKLDNTRTKIELVNGEEKLLVNGYVENLGTTGASVPQVLVQVTNSAGKVLDEWIVDPVGLIIRKNGRAPFTSMRDVPMGIANVNVSVIEGSKSSTRGEYP